MNNTLLENYIRENLLFINEAKQDITWGQLKKELKKFINLKKGTEISKAVAGFIPYVGNARDLYDVVKSLANIPDSKRSANFLGNFDVNDLDVDDQIAAIVDNKLEKEFIDAVVAEIESKDDEEVVQDFNMTDMLNKFLKEKFNGRGVTGYQE